MDGNDVWIGTYNAGVSRFDQLEDTWKNIQPEMMVYLITAYYLCLLTIRMSGSEHIEV